MQKWTIKIEVEISDNWVADGFNLKDDSLDIFKEAVENCLPYAYENEIRVKSKILKAPAKEKILELQGY